MCDRCVLVMCYYEDRVGRVCLIVIGVLFRGQGKVCKRG